MKRVLVAGATGYLGRHAVKAFKNQGYWVRALARSAGKLEPLTDEVDEAFIGAVTDSVRQEVRRGLWPILPGLHDIHCHPGRPGQAQSAVGAISAFGG